jgi:serine protease Do
MKRWSFACAVLLSGALAGALVVAPYALHGQNATAPVATAVPKEITSYRDVVKRVLPAVVSVEGKVKPVKAKQPRRRPAADDGQVPEEFRKFLDDLNHGQPDEDTPQPGFGSGFLVDPKGVVLTNYHVVEGADSVVVQLKDGRKFTSKDIHSDPKTDLAIVRFQSPTPLPYLEMGDSDNMEIGDRVLAVGAPFGLTGTVTAGIVSAKARSLRMNMYEDFLQTDAAINPGNSGGPLVNLEGKVIGINSAIKSRTGGFQGVGMAISSNLALNIERQLLKDGSVHRGYLGIQIRDVSDPDLAHRLGVEADGGVLVSQVFDKGPASKAGITEGDVITSLGGKPVHDIRTLQNAVANLPLNKPTTVAVVRDGKSSNMTVTIEEQPSEYGNAQISVPRLPRKNQDAVNLDKVGAEAVDMTSDLADKLGYKQTTGALVTKVDPDSAAAESGLGRGMLVTRVDKQPVKSAAELKEALGKASLEKGALLQVYSPTGSSFVLLKNPASK